MPFTDRFSYPVSSSSSWHKPFYFGMPTFRASAVLTMVIVAIVSMVESTGVFLALGKIVDQDIQPDGLAVMLGGLFNSFPYTTFSQNVGLVQLSKVKTRDVIYTAGFILIVLGFIPKFAAIATLIPSSVLGGAMVAMFGMVAAAGIKMLSEVDFARQENLLIIAVSIGLGLGVTVVPNFFAQLPQGIRILTDNGIVAGSVSAIVLNIVLNLGVKTKERDSASVRSASSQLEA